MRLLALFALAVALAALPGGDAAGEAPKRAGIVVSFGGGRTTTVCVEFAEAEITGAELLRRSGLSLVTTGGAGGAAVCKIEDVGCDNPNDCFCHCRGADCRYWAYYTLDAGAWKYSNVGASLRKVRDGDVDGWAWGSGKPGGGAQPELRAFEEICPPPTEPPPTLAPPPTEPALASQTVAPTLAATAAGATELPTATSTPAQTERAPAKAATKTPEAATKTPVATNTPSTEQGGDNGLDFPLELLGFGAVAAALGTVSLVLWRRSRG
ncbi:MAG: hypothetical protein QME71_05690 [Dehalococcoidia bacterium]|nr:hypothetical protein [Dehalococcoidia bacterium]